MEVLNVQRGDTCLDIRIIAFTICLGNIALRTCNCSGVGGKAVGSVIVCLLGIGRGDNNRYLTLELGVVVGGLCFGKGVCTYIQTLPFERRKVSAVNLGNNVVALLKQPGRALKRVAVAVCLVDCDSQCEGLGFARGGFARACCCGIIGINKPKLFTQVPVRTPTPGKTLIKSKNGLSPKR